MIYHDAERISGNSGLLLLVILSALSAIYSALFQLYDARTKLDGTRNVLIGQILLGGGANIHVILSHNLNHFHTVENFVDALKYSYCTGYFKLLFYRIEECCLPIFKRALPMND